MCGIAGIFSDKGEADSVLLKKMSLCLSHRGPDGEGIHMSGRVGLSHRRLSIIDLSENATQPMCSEDGNLWLVFNGEIFNYVELREELIENGHKFRSESDTEVILHSYEEWGCDCTKHFNGMWAFAIYDGVKEELFCSRDRFGIKPFYYAFAEGSFLFASEIKALLLHPLIGNEPCNEKLMSYLANAALDTDEKTMFEGVFQLRPATSMYVKDGVAKNPQKYWDFNVSAEVISSPDFSDKQAAEDLLKNLYDSVRLRLRSDVSVGTCLSGGLDSSTITLIINDLIKKENISSVGERQNTFSACYSDRRFDESSYMDIVIESTGVSAHKTYPNPCDITDDITHLIYMQDEPFGSLSVYSQYRVMKLAGDYVKVVLDGQGADEQLAGYIGYQAAYVRSLRGQPLRMLKEIWGSAKYHGGFFLSAVGQLNQRRRRRSFLKGDLSYIDRYEGTLDAVLKNELSGSNLQALLHYEDRNSMAFSIESRVPFLDYRLVEYIAKLPLDQKIRGGVTKYVLRKAIKGLVPERIRCRMDKMGFVTPEEVWMKDELHEFVLSVFESESFGRRRYWDADSVLNDYRDFCDKKTEYSPEFWRILCTELWLRIFFDKKGKKIS